LTELEIGGLSLFFFLYYGLWLCRFGVLVVDNGIAAIVVSVLRAIYVIGWDVVLMVSGAKIISRDKVLSIPVMVFSVVIIRE